MTWTYDPNLLALSDPVTIARYLVGDTDSTDPLIQDEELAYLVADEGNPIRAAARAAEGLAARYARTTDKIVGPLRLMAKDRQAHFLALSKQLWTTATSKTALPWIGADSKSLKQLEENDEDRVVPFATIDMMEYPNTMPIGNQEELVE